MTRTRWVSLFVGLIFGVGLVISGMTRPDKVIGFLDVAGAWDPSLMFVMGGGVAVYAVAWQVVRRWKAPLVAPVFALPTRRDIDGRLVAGAALFGLGWGIGGYCPGPALVSVPSGQSAVLVFVAAMIGGMQLFRVWDARGRAASAT